MPIASEMGDRGGIDPVEYLAQKEEFLEQRDEFMQIYLSRVWPARVLIVLGVFQLIISLAILAVDLPIILMFGPRWQVFAGCWTFLFGFIACVSTLHSTRKLTWLKLKWTVALNVLAGIAAAVMISFNILFSVNSNICLVSTGCTYLWYTYSASAPYYTGGAILGVTLFVTVFIFLIVFVKYGIGGIKLFEDIKRGLVTNDYKPIVPVDSRFAASRNPTTGPGVSMGQPSQSAMPPRFRPPPPPGMVPRFRPPPPPPGMPPRFGPPPTPGMMPRYGPPPPPGMVQRYGPPPPPGMAQRYGPPPPPGMMQRYGPPPPLPPLGMMPRNAVPSNTVPRYAQPGQSVGNTEHLPGPNQ